MLYILQCNSQKLLQNTNFLLKNYKGNSSIPNPPLSSNNSDNLKKKLPYHHNPFYNKKKILEKFFEKRYLPDRAPFIQGVKKC